MARSESKRGLRRELAVGLMLLAAMIFASDDLEAQQEPDSSVQRENAVGFDLLKNLWSDQKTIWTSPARLRWDDAIWLLPFAEATGGFLATDRTVPPALSNSPSRLKEYREISDDGVAALVAGSGALYFWGLAARDPQKRETGVLAAEAAVDALVASSVTEYLSLIHI